MAGTTGLEPATSDVTGQSPGVEKPGLIRVFMALRRHRVTQVASVRLLCAGSGDTATDTPLIAA